MPGLPRNVGIQLARGKYIAFLDSDDLFTETALEELSTLAEEYQADVVNMYKYFTLWGGKPKSVEFADFSDMNFLMNSANWTVKTEKKANRVKVPTLESSSIAERMRHFIEESTFWTSWLSFYRREFLLTNQILFPPMITSEDASFVFAGWCLAEKLLRVPNTTYIRRPRAGSVAKENVGNIDLNSYFHKKVSSFIEGTKALNEVMSRIDFFKKNSSARHAVLYFFYRKSFSYCARMHSMYEKNPIFELNELAEKEFHSDDADFAAYLFGAFVYCRNQIRKLKAENEELKKIHKQ